MRDFFLTILIFVIIIVFLIPEFLNFTDYRKINRCKNKSLYYP